MDAKKRKYEYPLVSVIVPVHNASPFLMEALSSIERQSYRPLEVCLYDDKSSDNSLQLVMEWKGAMGAKGSDINIIVQSSSNAKAGGPGHGRNSCVALSRGSLLCHLDSDDVMAPDRIREQVKVWEREGSNCIIGCNFDRLPLDSTPYYTNWLNAMSDEDLRLHQYRECTIICPSWLYSRHVYDRIAAYRYSLTNKGEGGGDGSKGGGEGGAKEKEKEKDGEGGGAAASEGATTLVDPSRGSTGHEEGFGTHYCAFLEAKDAAREGLDRVPEDLYFFLDHLLLGGGLSKVHGPPLVTYRYAEGSWALGTKSLDLIKVRLKYFEKMVLSKPEWSSFTIWGYGKNGKKILSLFSAENEGKVAAFCDFDDKKCGRKHYCMRAKKHIPVTHFSDAKPPLLICVSSKRADGDLEVNVKSLGLVEGRDYFHFS